MYEQAGKKARMRLRSTRRMLQKGQVQTLHLPYLEPIHLTRRSRRRNMYLNAASKCVWTKSLNSTSKSYAQSYIEVVLNCSKVPTVVASARQAQDSHASRKITCAAL